MSDDQNNEENNESMIPESDQGKMSRRDFLKRSAVFASGTAALVAAMSPLRLMEDMVTPEEFVQKHYKEMTKEELDKVIKRISGKVKDILTTVHRLGEHQFSDTELKIKRLHQLIDKLSPSAILADIEVEALLN